MLSRLIVQIFPALIEFSLWVSLAIGAYGGWLAGDFFGSKLVGMLVGLVLIFMWSATLLGVILAIVDIRKTVLTLEQGMLELRKLVGTGSDTLKQLSFAGAGGETARDLPEQRPMPTGVDGTTQSSSTDCAEERLAQAPIEHPTSDTRRNSPVTCPKCMQMNAPGATECKRCRRDLTR